VAQTIVLHLIQPYVFKPTDSATLEQQAQARRTLSEEFIHQAAAQMYPEGMTRTEGRIFKGIINALAANTDAIELNDTEFDFLYDMFMSPRASTTLKFKPIAMSWFVQWLDYLEAVKKAM